MNTWQIWHILRYPPRRNMMFYWAWRNHRARDKQADNTKSGWHKVLRGISVLAGIALVLAITPVALVVTLLMLLGLPVLILVFNGTVLGLYWVSTVTTTLAYYLHGGRGDILSATPRGTLGFSWIIATGCINRGDLLRDAYRLVRWVMVTVIGMLLIVLLVIGLNLAEAPTRVGQIILLIDLIGMMAFVVGTWLDHIQSIVVATLIALLAPTYTTERPLIRISAGGMFITLQIFFYSIIVLIFRVIYLLTGLVVRDAIMQRLTVLILCLLAFYGVRELLITVLQQLMLKRYEVTKSEFKAVVS